MPLFKSSCSSSRSQANGSSIAASQLTHTSLDSVADFTGMYQGDCADHDVMCLVYPDGRTQTVTTNASAG